ncbi:uncharacterized protein LOC116722004 isoform X3 [Xiphophorus hellerii]|uniref:uncharacterized protein LOC116722004 isoform X3 n=1 Tax=Xiphophorus hellerii TaxID=8084 RepID=UPI0013B36A6A|nr:uncharacterized protein LOC116722004 isoform X3 [Xiphophorus hellerii]
MKCRVFSPVKKGLWTKPQQFSSFSPSPDPVGPVDLTVDSVSSDSSSFTATCTADGTDISSTFRCTAKTCLQEGGEGSKVTKSGAALLVCLSRSAVVCNHSNQVSWMEKTAEIDHLCLKNAGPDEPHGFSICYVKKVVFSVGLIVMVLVVIAVHLKEKFNKHK